MWKREWEQWVVDAEVPLEQRLTRFYIDYARTILTRQLGPHPAVVGHE